MIEMTNAGTPVRARELGRVLPTPQIRGARVKPHLDLIWHRVHDPLSAVASVQLNHSRRTTQPVSSHGFPFLQLLAQPKSSEGGATITRSAHRLTRFRRSTQMVTISGSIYGGRMCPVNSAFSEFARLLAKRIRAQTVRLMLATCFATALLGCAAPGTPMVRTGVQDGEGPMVPGCKNVSSKYRVDNYITDYYLTTSSSALLEGATQGVEEGYREALAGMTREQEEAWSKAVAQTVALLPDASTGTVFVPESFCRRFPSSSVRVAAAVAKILPSLGNPITKVDEQRDYFETGFIEREHRAARWRDRYIIWLDRQVQDVTVVHVVRFVFISRKGAAALADAKKSGRASNPYNQGISVGHNEAWLLTKIDDLSK